MTPSNRTSAEALQTLMTLGVLGEWSDGRLLELYRSRRPGAEEAFRVLVRRHGPMVLAACRAIAGPVDADDAFQAVFLVLIRRADSIRKRDSVGPWLHGVAVRVARKTRRMKSRDAARFRLLDPAALAATAERGCTSDGSAQIHAEIDRLPDRDRLPLVLCALEGMSYDEAARSLGVSEPTLRGRLHWARQRLEARLRSQGVAVPSTFLLPTPPNGLLDAVYAIGRAAVPPIPTMISSIAKGAIFAMAFSTSKILAGLTLTAMLTTLGVLGSEVVVGLWSPPQLEYESGLGTGYSIAAPPEPPFPPITPPEPIRPPDLTPEQVEARNRSIWASLAKPLDFDYPEGITLGAFLKRIKQETAKGDDPGIPIYVEPSGLEAAAEGMESHYPLVSKGKPITETLKVFLGAMSLGYAVEGGFLRVDSRVAAAEYRLEAIEAKLDRLIERLEARNDLVPH